MKQIYVKPSIRVKSVEPEMVLAASAASTSASPSNPSTPDVGGPSWELDDESSTGVTQLAKPRMEFGEE